MAANIDLCTRADVRLALEIQEGQTGRDALIDDAISDASQRIIDYTERELAPAGTVATRLFPISGRQTVIDLCPYDLVSATAVKLHPELGASAITLVADTDYTLEPVPARWGVYYQVRLSSYLNVWSQFEYSFGTARLSVAGTWGFPEVPRAARRACIITASSWVDRKAGMYSPQEDSAGRVILPDTAGGLDIPNSAKRQLDPLKRRLFV